ncbi:MAG: response regulator [Cyclobacteriaceae bacterium]|nr:response regulator [Cyclobacteriaceae bacterium]
MILPLWNIMEKKLVIAIFENDPLNRFIYQKMSQLQLDKASFHIFNTPEEGLELAAALKFDIAFIDMHLRGEYFGGVSLCKELRAISKQTKMVAMTTLIQQGDIERASSNGFLKCLEKPLPFFDLDKLLEGVIYN